MSTEQAQPTCNHDWTYIGSKRQAMWECKRCGTYKVPDDKETEQQEPWGWRWKERINNDLESWVITASEPPPYAIEKQPLYTAPPQRESLTDQEIGEVLAAVLMQHSSNLFYPFARAIEAAHGIKEKT